MVIISEVKDTVFPSGLEHMERMVAAYRRIKVLSNHLTASALPMGNGLRGNELVPMPGTFEHEKWMSTLGRCAPNSNGMRILQEWNQHFFSSGPEVKTALRRFLVLSCHLTAPSSILAAEVVN